jgi:glycosyltransferase involved in cell wall biosynthesis
MEGPLVSIVTPFYNTAAWLPECIKSVLAQTHENWEYILLDNCSTDGSTDIARQYAASDARIRYTRNSEVLSQVRNYNAALALISSESLYCKIVQADDWIFPSCISSMVDVFQSSESIGLVSSYYLKGALVRGYGLPYPSRVVRGKELVRLLLVNGVWVFGSPSAVMYRSSIVRAQRPFYDESCLHEDTEACIRMLKEWDLGFVHQVLSFLRTDNESITSSVRAFNPDFLDYYIMVRRYAPIFLSPNEAASIGRDVKDWYYGFLAGSVLKGRGRAFWRYHGEGLRTIGEDLDRLYLLSRLARKLVWYAINPGLAISLALPLVKDRPPNGTAGRSARWNQHQSVRRDRSQTSCADASKGD